ncbi:helix-turn-helix domain-containing protein [Aeribacillus composti]|uniref:helix-turn-helix domain-containing protein n=1 Tax=Aeribacillus composti TaxID=1868734 RepID=UPI0028713470|nr:helix-turn-helix transcriptional regulator [Aeribacillus pallidus]
MQPVGKIIKDLRLKRGLSQEELAEKINEKFGTSLNKGMISKWENGLGDPRLETVRHLALFFNVSLDYLLGLDQPQTLAAHHDGDEDWTEEELEEIERFKEFIRSKRKRQE